MAQKTNEVRIGNKMITVRELSVLQIWGLVGDPEEDNKKGSGGETKAQPLDSSLLGDIGEKLDTFLGLATDITRDDLLGMYPSEIEEIWQAFREVNSSFLGLTQKLWSLGFNQLLKKFMPVILEVIEETMITEMRAAAGPISSQPSVSASSEAITTSGTTAGPSS